MELMLSVPKNFAEMEPSQRQFIAIFFLTVIVAGLEKL